MAVRFRRGLGKEQVSVACAVAGSATMLTGHRSIRGLEPQAANPVHVEKKKKELANSSTTSTSTSTSITMTTTTAT